MRVRLTGNYSCVKTGRFRGQDRKCHELHSQKDIQLLPNTSGARNIDEAVRIARLAKASGCGNWIKIEVISDNKYLLPDGYATVKATEILANEDFVVLPYISPDLMVAKQLVDAGAAAVMPLGAPIGSNRGLKTERNHTDFD